MHGLTRHPGTLRTLRRATVVAPRLLAAEVSTSLDAVGGALSAALSGAVLWTTRPRRVHCLLAAIWVLNLFDLGFTVTASSCRFFDELNPLARGLIGEPTLLALYKLTLLIPCTLILSTLRGRRVTELAAWLGLAVYATVTVRWFIYYAHVSVALEDPAVPVETAVLAMRTWNP